MSPRGVRLGWSDRLITKMTGRAWAQARHDYEAKARYLSNDCRDFAVWEDPYEFYRTLFGQGFLESPGMMLDWDEPGGGKPNGIILEVTSKTRLVTLPNGHEVERTVNRRYTITDDLEAVYTAIDSSARDLTSAYTSPVSYFGKARSAQNARFLHAFAIDLDGVAPDNLVNLVFQARHNTVPCPTEIVISGTGVHVYYRLAQPVPLVPRHVPALQRMKRYLTRMVWNECTSTIPSDVSNDKRQYQGIYQPYRLPGSSTKLNGHAPGQKRANDYPALAYRVWHQDPWTLEELADALHGVDAKTLRTMKDEFHELWETAGRTPLERAKKMWPDWYQRRIVDGAEPQDWPHLVNRAVYDAWLKRIREEVHVGHRYNAIRTLAANAVKCGIGFDELEDDALELFEIYSRMPAKPGNQFTLNDLYTALEAYEDPSARRWKNEYMANSAGIKPKKNKRNWQKQSDHLEEARAIRDVRQRRKKSNWWDGAGRPAGSGTKEQLVLDYAAAHPEANHSEIARALGISRPTVIKWLRSDSQDDSQP